MVWFSTLSVSVQALSALVIALLTWRLVRITRRYAKDTEKMVQEEMRAYQYEAVSRELDVVQDPDWIKDKVEKIYNTYLHNLHKEKDRIELKKPWEEFYDPNGPQRISNRLKNISNEVALRYNRIGAMMEKGIFTPEGKETFLELCDDAIIYLWRSLEPWVNFQRERAENQQANYCEHFEKLAQEAKKYHKQNHSGVSIYLQYRSQVGSIEIYSSDKEKFSQPIL